MSLATDSLFIAAIRANNSIMSQIGGRLYSTSIPLPDEDADNVHVPYIIVTFDGLNNEQTTKDDPFEGDDDKVTIGIEVCARNRSELAGLASIVRAQVHSYMVSQLEGENPSITDYVMSAEAVQYDSMKPCYWQTLRYVCDVTNTFD